MKSNLAPYMIVVDNRLIRGKAVTSPLRLYKMKKEGINQVIDLRNTSYVAKPLEKVFCKMLGIKYQNYKYPHRLDELPSPDFFLTVNNSIIKNDGKTYIHCVALYEKYFTKKSINQIISDMINIGFQDIFNKPQSPRSKKYYNIIKQFLNTYCFKNSK